MIGERLSDSDSEPPTGERPLTVFPAFLLCSLSWVTAEVGCETCSTSDDPSVLIVFIVSEVPS